MMVFYYPGMERPVDEELRAIRRFNKKVKLFFIKLCKYIKKRIER
jgi:hypothetical protein